MLWITRREVIDALKAEFDCIQRSFAGMQWVERGFLRDRVPALAEEYCAGGIYEPDVFDIDVHALHDAYLRGFTRRGGVTTCRATVTGLERDGDDWIVRVGEKSASAPIVVNAAGAWVDEIAGLAEVRPVGIRPLRRTAALLDAPPGVSVDAWPLIMDHGGAFYFKPDAGLVLASPADETPSAPCDAQPEELDVAYAAHYAEQALGLRVQRVKHAWAGLRSFVQDRCPVIGFAPDATGFFWMAAQGGHGIQIAPAAARLAAALIRAEPVPADLAELDFDPGSVSPRRLFDNAGELQCAG
jgi:D-arginine dehydrogenase